MNTDGEVTVQRLLYGAIAVVVLAALGWHEYRMRQKLQLARQAVAALREALNGKTAA